MTITPEQLITARNLLGWSQSDLAGHVGVSATTVSFFEIGKRRLPKLDLDRARSALETAGVSSSSPRTAAGPARGC